MPPSSRLKRPPLIRIVSITFVLGVIVTLFFFHAWTVYGLRAELSAQQAQVSEQRTALEQVVKFANTQMEQQQAIPEQINQQQQLILQLQTQQQQLMEQLEESPSSSKNIRKAP